MENIHWELTVLSKAVAFPNLSTAAIHVRLSQPQLSRIVQKIEKEIGANLLDRSSKRKAAWTPLARAVAENVERSNRSLSENLQRVLREQTLSHLTVGTLEGLAPLASRLCFEAGKTFELNITEIEVLDLGYLEEAFLRGAYDLYFTMREPGARKFSRLVQIGYQSLEMRNPDSQLKVMSPFEAGRLMNLRKTREAGDKERKVIANTLEVRRDWVENYGASGIVPTEVFKKKKAGPKPESVFVIGSEHMGDKDWEQIKTILLRL